MTLATPETVRQDDYWSSRPRLPSGAGAALLASLTELVSCVDRRETFAVPAPFTGETLGALPRCTAADVERAAARARGAQSGWAATDVRARENVLLRFHDLLL